MKPLGLGHSHQLLFPKCGGFPLSPEKTRQRCAQDPPLCQGREPATATGAQGSACTQEPFPAGGDMHWQKEPGGPSPGPCLPYVDLFQVSRLNICILEMQKKNQATTGRVPKEEVSDTSHTC